MTQPSTTQMQNATNTTANMPESTQQGLSQQTIDRRVQLQTWLASVFEGDFQVESLPGDASFRCYHRVYLSNTPLNQEGSKGYIVMDAPPQKESVVEFVAVAEMMAGVVNVPDIVAKDIASGFLVLQDFGNTEFAHLLIEATEEQIDGYYKQAMSTLHSLQTLDITFAKKSAHLPDYDVKLLEQEMDLFTQWFVPHIGIDITTTQGKESSTSFEPLWQEFKNQIVSEVLRQPKVVVHRDYHSRNLMQDKANPNDLGVIDFQDAVIGAYSYDLVSLLRDAYVHWNETIIDGWVQTFWQNLDPKLKAQMATASYDQFYQDMMVMGVQRHLKVLGIFVRLAKRDGKTRYLADIPKVMDDLLFELNWLQDNGTGDIQAVTTKLVEWVKTVVEPAYQHTFLKSE